MTSKFITEARKFFESNAPAADAGDDDEAAPAGEAIAYVPDLLSEAKVYEWAGIGFGQQEIMLL